VAKDGFILQFASTGLREDRKVVMKAVGQNWRALQFASEDLKADREIMLARMGTLLSKISVT